MREELIVDGVIYCDFRVNIYNCQESNYFLALHCIALALASLELIGATLVLIYRVSFEF